MWLAIGILSVASVLYFSRLGKSPLVVNAEIRNHEVVSGMLKTGDYLVPRMDGEIRVQKPPLFYWLAAGSAKLFGGLTLSTFRLPGSIAALAVLLVMLWWGRLRDCSGEGLLAAGLLAVTYMFTLHGRRGSFEMLLSLFCNLSVLYCYLLARDGYKTLFAVLAALTFALGFLTKATPILLYVPLPIVIWLIMEKRTTVFRDWRLWAFSAAGLLLGISWYIYLFTLGSETRHIIISEFLLPFGKKDPEIGSAAHFAPPWFFLKEIWRATFPICLFLPLNAWYWWRTRLFSNDPAMRLLSLVFLAPFVIFSIIPQKQDHYLLPGIVALAVVTSHVLFLATRELSGKWKLLYIAPFSLLAIIAMVASVAGGWAFRIIADASWPVALVFSGCMVLLSVMLFLCILKQRWVGFAILGFITVALAYFGYFTRIRTVEDGFESGRIMTEANFNAEEWDKKFETYKWLGLEKMLSADKGSKRLRKGHVR